MGTQSLAGNKYDEEEELSCQGKRARAEKQAETWFRGIAGKWIANRSWGKTGSLCPFVCTTYSGR